MNIFIAKLNYRTDSDVLREAFEEYGEVTSSKVIVDRITDRSKGYGFVEMPDEQEALRAIEGLNNSELDGSTIIVKKANPKNSNYSDHKKRNWYR